jgi:hypothetical protein
VVTCPFCGAPETDRFEIDGQRFLVFGCMFSPSVDPGLTDSEITEHLLKEYGPQGSAYFRGVCDRLHRVVTQRPELSPPEPPTSE